MGWRVFLSFFLLAFFGALVAAQIPIPGRGRPSRPPTLPPETGAGLPWPEGLSRGEVLTGRVGAIDKDQIMIHSMDMGDVLFWVDDKTVIHVGDFRLAMTDLRVGDPIAVKLRKVKGKGPVAKEILPHPDVKARKIKGESKKPASPAETARASTDTSIVPAGTMPATGVAPLAGMPSAPSASPSTAAATAAAPGADEFPALPPGAHGVVGTVTNASGDSLEVRDRDQKTEKVVLTGVTLIKKSGTETILPGVKNGDHVAIAGDRMDNGDWIAREVLVVVPPGAENTAAAAPGAPGAAAAVPARDPDVGADGLARFSGKIVRYENEEAKIETPRGVRTVLVTGITDVRRMGMRRDASALKVGDSVSVVGDVLEGGIISAREVTVTTLSGS